MQLVQQNFNVTFYFRLSKYRKLVKFTIYLWDTTQTFTNYDKQNSSSVQAVKYKIKKTNIGKN